MAREPKKPLTPEEQAQKEADALAKKLEKEMETYKGYCVESQKYTQSADHYNDFNKLIELVTLAKEIKTQMDELRQRIKADMQACKCTRAINLQHRKQLTISKAGRTSSRKEFDVDSFKKDHPDLYEKYCYNVGGHYTNGGNLCLRDINDKAMEYYLKPEFSEYFPTESE